jgi:p38 MAP kinase
MDSRPSHEEVPQYNAMDKAQAAMRYDYDVVNSFDFSWYVDWKRGL